jgi:chorismate dehydratase
VNIALVSYLNTRPFTDALSKDTRLKANLLLLPPSQCAVAVQDGRADIALVPVGAIPDLKGIRILPDYCIGATGAVGSVFLFGETPVDQWDTVILDPHSRSSNGLARVLIRYKWRKEVQWQASEDRPFDLIKGTTGGVAIGDEAIRAADRYPYVYDLAMEWQDLTGWPFVFAVWVYRPDRVSPAQLEIFNQAISHAPGMAAESAERWSAHYGISPAFGRQYLTEKIKFHFDAPKHHAFQAYLQALKTVEAAPTLSI